MFIRDGYITGVLKPHLGTCPLCGAPRQRIIDVASVETPHGFGAEATVMFNRADDAIHSCLGLTCGCYAKFHRQVVHIQESQLAAGRMA